MTDSILQNEQILDLDIAYTRYCTDTDNEKLYPLYQLNSKGCKKIFETKYVKYLTDDEVNQLRTYFYSLGNPRLGFLFDCMVIFSSRIGDLVKFKKSNFVNDCRELIYIEEKKNKLRRVFIPQFFKIKLLKFFEQYELKSDDYLFKPEGRSNQPHITKATVRWHFLKFRRMANLNDSYYTTKHANSEQARKLHRITPHTIRHYGIYKFLKACDNDYNQAKLYSNHSKIDMIAHYAATLDGIEKQADFMDKAFSDKLK